MGLDYPDETNKEDQSPRDWLHPGGDSTASRCKQSEPEPKVSTDKTSTNVTSLLNELGRELQKELKSEKGSKILDLFMKTVSAVLAATGVPEDWEQAAVSEKAEVTESALVPATRPQSYAKAASKGG